MGDVVNIRDINTYESKGMKEAEESLHFIWGTYSGKTKNMSEVPGSP